MEARADSLIGEAPAFLDVMDQISHAAPMTRPTLIVGERGTGKEMIAARLHYLSDRWNAPFAKLNCAALPENLLESELFGHEAGAFTGATKKRIGRFEEADGGTLFLDEIGTLSLNAQEKLLRVIEYGSFERIGGNRTQTVDVRVVGATNVDLPAAAETGHFRLDLLDRLAFDVITLPPLRARVEDIPVLAHHFGQRMAREQEWLTFPGFTDDAMARLMAHPWPGNIRELKNVVERAVHYSWDGEAPLDQIIFDPFDSPWRPGAPGGPMRQAMPAGREATPPEQDGASAKATEPSLPDGPFDLKQHLQDTEKRLVAHALKRARYNQRLAASHTGLSYDQFRHLARKHGLIGPGQPGHGA
ncbi:phage shock protein operon transcriptional activator [Yunchengibacter salinarum]|uniref:phage shock protein operon transcriptional activator n=1 Tax=Yunchengibacter salinarum TaxID=3133399 RepID=UPI0035B57B6A